MAVATFDMLKFANTLKSAGVPVKQAEAIAVIYYNAFQSHYSSIAQKGTDAEESDRKSLCEKEVSSQSEAKFEPVNARSFDVGFIALQREFRLTIWLAAANALLIFILLILTSFIPVQR